MSSNLEIPTAVAWTNGMVLEPGHFDMTDHRAAALSHIAALFADPWPWGFARTYTDDTALTSGQLRVVCDGVFPDGQPFRDASAAATLPPGEDGQTANYHLVRAAEGNAVSLFLGDDDVPGDTAMPVARLMFRGGTWGSSPDWSPPALLISSDHPLRQEANRQIGGLAAIASGFMTTLRLPGAENRPVARTMAQVVTHLAQGVGTLEALLGAPSVSPWGLGAEALRLALGVRAAAGVYERLEKPWDPADQRSSLRRLLYAAESAASGIGLPFRTASFRDRDGILMVDDMPQGNLLLVIEVARPADLIVARSWLDGAALAAPDRIQDALTRRVSGCTRQPVERDATIGVSSGPLLALYQVNDDAAWRGGHRELALAAETPPPQNTSFSILTSEGAEQASAAGSTHTRPSWASGGQP